jgi:hypothetical protein
VWESRTWGGLSGPLLEDTALTRPSSPKLVRKGPWRGLGSHTSGFWFRLLDPLKQQNSLRAGRWSWCFVAAERG